MSFHQKIGRRALIRIFAAMCAVAARPALALPPSSSTLVTENQKLTTSDGEPGDEFGHSVAVSGNTAVIGALVGDGPGSVRGTGSAYVYQNNGLGQWTQQAELVPSNGAQLDYFGVRVAIEGNTIIVGASAPYGGSGAAYVFERSGSVWSQTARLTASDAALGDQFGFPVDISGNRAIVGGYLNDDAGADSGSAYVFSNVGGTWGQVAKLTAADASANDQFGNSAAIDGSTAIVGAYRDGPAGSAYIFREDGLGSWQQLAKLTPSSASLGAEFGHSIALEGNLAVVGARIDGAVPLTRAGAAYVFRELTPGAWVEVAKLQPDVPMSYAQFGVSVGISNGRIIVGADTADGADTDSGAAYVFEETSPGVWTQIFELIQSDPTYPTANFAFSTSLSGDTAVVGAPRRNFDQGSAYVFNVGNPVPEPQCWQLLFAGAATWLGAARTARAGRAERQ